jgi:hypothetical protein
VTNDRRAWRRGIGVALLALAIAWDVSVVTRGEPLNWQAPAGPYLLATAASLLLVWPARGGRLLASYLLCLGSVGASGAIATALAAHADLSLAPVLARGIIYMLLPFLWLVSKIHPR